VLIDSFLMNNGQAPTTKPHSGLQFKRACDQNN
jgi:hypothetical protein